MFKLFLKTKKMPSWYYRWDKNPISSIIHAFLGILLLTVIVGSIVNLIGGGNAAGKIYYVAANGSDSNSGTSQDSPWRTLDKVNATTFSAGDQVLFRRGDTFYGTLNISSSGSASEPIIFGAYGNGEKPIITGFKTISDWVSIGNGIYSSADSSFGPDMINMVTLNDNFQAIGRWPREDSTNSGYLTISSHSGVSSINSNDINSAPNFVGGEVVIRSNHWILDRGLINKQTSNQISYTPIVYRYDSYEPQDGYGFFFQNSISALSKLGDWAYNQDKNKFYMYFGSSVPNNYLVKVSVVNNLVNINNSNYINIDNISFTGSNQKTFNINNSKYININNSSLSFAGINTLEIDSPSSYISLTNSTISYTNNNAITANWSNYLTVKNNTITNTAMTPGMGQGSDSQYIGIMGVGSNSVITNNVIYGTGYTGIFFGGKNITIKNNYINNFCSVKDDGAGIYTYNSDNTGTIVSDNIVVNGLGSPNGTSNNKNYAEGIYADDQTRNLTITGNTVANTDRGFYIHNAHELNIQNNVSFNNNRQIEFSHDDISPNSPIRNIDMYNNIFVSKDNDQINLRFSSIKDDVTNFGIAKNNIYSRPTNESTPFIFSGTYKTLADWQVFSKQDLDSKKAPISIDSSSKIVFDYNQSNTSKTISLSGTYINMFGEVNSTCFTTIPAWKSVVLLQTSTTCNSTQNSNTDTIKPSVSITNSNTTSTISGQLTLLADALDNIGVDHVDFYNGSSIISGDATSPYSISIDTTTLSNGTYTFSAKAYDKAGNYNTSNLMTLKIENIVTQPMDTTFPNISISSPVNNSSISGKVTLVADASDNAGISKVEFYRGQTLIDTDTTGSPYMVAWDTGSLSNGNYIITAKATDLSGNVTISNSINVILNNSQPTSNMVGKYFDASKSIFSGGYRYMIDENFGTDPDNMSNLAVSKVQIYENGKPLGPAHSAHADIESLGAGRYSYWGNSSDAAALYFSSSDNTDPRTNGRVYSYSLLDTTNTTSGDQSNTNDSSSGGSNITGTVENPSIIVFTISKVNVRSKANTWSKKLGTQLVGARGKVVSTTTFFGTTWFNVDFDSGVDGWVPVSYLRIK